MIIQVADTLISSEIFSEHFVCHLEKCKGICCVEGDQGAPVDKNEVDLISENLKKIKPFMNSEFAEFVEKNGLFETDEWDDNHTNCLPSGECVFTYKNSNGVYSCAIETAYLNGEINFNKPISCHLYPIRIGKILESESINYHQWKICSPACENGQKLGVPLFVFLKNALIRKFGQDWYNELELVFQEFKNIDAEG